MIKSIIAYDLSNYVPPQKGSILEEMFSLPLEEYLAFNKSLSLDDSASSAYEGIKISPSLLYHEKELIEKYQKYHEFLNNQ